MNNIYTVVVHGKSFVEALTESEAVDISLNVNLTKSILKADLDVSIDSIEYSLKTLAP